MKFIGGPSSECPKVQCAPKPVPYAVFTWRKTFEDDIFMTDSPSKDMKTDDGPPTPPPAPPIPTIGPNKVSGRVPNFKLKTRDSLHDRTILSSRKGPDLQLPQLGPYFVYGTLMDSSMLRDVLNLDYTPRLRPARVVGHRCRSWGQYPAIVDGESEQEVLGMIYEVETSAHATRLAEYESNNYRVAPATVYYTDGLEPQSVGGWTFNYAGRESELSDEEFNIENWLKRVGRVGSV